MAAVSLEFDDQTGLPLVRKKVGERRKLTSTLPAYMASGANVTGVVNVTATNLGRVPGSGGITISGESYSAQAIYFLAAGGTVGETYQIDVDFTTSEGEQLVASGALAVVA